MPIELIPAEEMFEEKTEKATEKTEKATEKTEKATEKIEKAIDEEEIKKKFEYVINFFQKTNPNPTTELKYKNGFELLVATILSAQSTDKRVNIITPDLFNKFPTPEEMAKATSEDIFKYINSITYPGNKSEYLVKMSKMLVEKYNSKIPEDINELQKLPGVGRKTANIIAATLYNKPALAVDTHVLRVSDRIGLTIDAAKNPLEAEEQLVRYIPKEVIPKFNYWLVLHGRYICTAKNPRHQECGIRDVCNYYIRIKIKSAQIKSK